MESRLYEKAIILGKSHLSKTCLGSGHAFPQDQIIFFLFHNISFLWDLIYLDNVVSFHGVDMERTDNTNRILEDRNWKERFITTSRNRATSGKAPCKNEQKI